jgi:hypothetical protein
MWLLIIWKTSEYIPFLYPVNSALVVCFIHAGYIPSLGFTRNKHKDNVMLFPAVIDPP